MKFLTVILFVLSLGFGVKASEPSLVNAIAVIVNDNVVTIKDVQSRLREDVEALDRRYAGKPEILREKLAELEKEGVEELVERHLILNEFKTAGYILPESLIETRIQEDIKQKYGDRLTLTQTLQAQGMTYDSYRTQLRERIILQMMWRQKVPIDPLISPANIQKYYDAQKENFHLEDEIRLRMIVVTNLPNDKLTPVKLAKEILAKIDEGAPFADMAKVYSQGSQASEGGDWGWVEKKILRKDLGEVAFTLKPGQHSGIIEAADGAYIVLVEESRPAHIKPLSEVREEIESTLKAAENKRLRKQWIDRLKAKSFVRYF